MIGGRHDSPVETIRTGATTSTDAGAPTRYGPRYVGHRHACRYRLTPTGRHRVTLRWYADREETTEIGERTWDVVGAAVIVERNLGPWLVIELVASTYIDGWGTTTTVTPRHTLAVQATDNPGASGATLAPGLLYGEVAWTLGVTPGPADTLQVTLPAYAGPARLWLESRTDVVLTVTAQSYRHPDEDASSPVVLFTAELTAIHLDLLLPPRINGVTVENQGASQTIDLSVVALYPSAA